MVPGLCQHVRLLSPSGPEIQRGRHPENQPLRADQIFRGVGTSKRREAQEGFLLKTHGEHCFNIVIQCTYICTCNFDFVHIHETIQQ